MFKDIISAISQWRVVHLLGMSALRGRFARSKFGQTWIAISVFVNTCIFGIVWSEIWKVPVIKYLPYVGIGNVTFLFVSQAINESTGIFIANARLYVNQKIPLSLSVLAHIYRSTIILLHNIPIIIVLFIWSPYCKLKLQALTLPGVLVTLLFLFFASHALAILCVRFRDLIQVVAVIMQSMFLITPVMWNVDAVSEKYRNLIYLNPFAAILDIWRKPFFGQDVPNLAYISILLWSILAFCCAVCMHKKFCKNLVFWM